MKIHTYIGIMKMMDMMKKLLPLLLLTYFVQSNAQDTENKTANVINIGAGNYFVVDMDGLLKVYKSDNIQGALPIEKWWRTVLTGLRHLEQLFPLPLCMQAKPEGLSIGYPDVHIRNLSFSGRYVNDMTIGINDINFPNTTLDDYGDWTITMLRQSESTRMWATLGQGSPYVFITAENGNVNITFPKAPIIWSGEASSNIGLTSNGHHYGIFAYPGTQWTGIGSTSIINQGSSGVSIALLPENTERTLQLFGRYSFNKVTSSKVTWFFDEQSSKLKTTFTITTDPPGKQTILALFPHQWKYYFDLYFLNYDYHTVRGKMKTIIGDSFTTVYIYNGILPALPLLNSSKNNLTEGFSISTLQQYIESVRVEGLEKGDHFSIGGEQNGINMFWAGKAFQRISMLVTIAQQAGDLNAAKEFLDWLKIEIPQYFVATGKNGELKADRYFYYETFLGTLLMSNPDMRFPDETDEPFDDHHSHYGYWIKACAEIALHDKEWVSKWGPFVNILVNDIANSNRSDKKFPFLRNFDPYLGHSWASGDELKQGATARATNAWSALILWGEATSNKVIRDLGIYLFTTEVTAIEQYFFDIDRDIFPTVFQSSTIGLIGGSGSEFNYDSRIGGGPEDARLFHLMPMTPSSMYLGYHPGYVLFQFEQIKKEKNGGMPEKWVDLFWQYLSLTDADSAINLYHGRPEYKIEKEESAAHTYSMLYAMKGLGMPFNRITANTTLYGVFKRGNIKTYVAYNSREFDITVKFSDGKILHVPPKKLAISQ